MSVPRPDEPMRMAYMQAVLDEANVILERHDKPPVTARVVPGDPTNPPEGWLQLCALHGDADGSGGPLIMDADMRVLARSFMHDGNRLELLCDLSDLTYGETLWLIVDACGVPC